MRVTKDWLLPFLKLLAGFLNEHFEPKAWKGFLERSSEFGNTLTSEFSGQQGVEKAKSLQAEIRDLLRDIIEGDPVAQKAEQMGWPRPTLYEALFTLADNLNDLKLVQYWQILPANKKAADIMGCKYERKRSRPGEPFLEIGESKWQVRSWPLTGGARAWLYSILSSALENNELPRLRICLQCQKYFVAEDLKRKFCCDACKVEYHNKRRLADGYFRENRKLRKKVEQARLGGFKNR